MAQQTRVNITLIGAGRLGQTLGRLWHQHKLAEISRVYTRSIASAMTAIEFIGAGQAYALGNSLNHDLQDPCSDTATIVWIFTPDDKIASACNLALELNLIKRDALVIHSSGTLGCDVLSAAKQLGCRTASAHPLCSIAAPSLKADQFNGVNIGIEVSDHDLTTTALLRHLFEPLGAQLIPISSPHKPLYHAAAVLASNFLPCLYDAAKQGFEQSGLSPSQANTSILGLMQTMLDNLKSLDTTDPINNALSGPLARGDARVITQHINALDQMSPDILSLYQTLSLQSLHLTNHSDDLKHRLIQLLTHQAPDSGK